VSLLSSPPIDQGVFKRFVEDGSLKKEYKEYKGGRLEKNRLVVFYASQLWPEKGDSSFSGL
jgi:hypothetical protein